MTHRGASAPLVSVIAICYNHQDFVRNCLDSIATQTYPNLEVIVLDDYSEDGSLDVIKSWITENGSPVTLIAHEENRGICRSRNEAVMIARGDYLACISTDDEWLPDKIAVQVEQMGRSPDRVAVAYGDALLMDKTGATIPGRFIARNREYTTPPSGRIFEELLSGNFIPSLNTLVRRRCINDIGGYDESLVYEDWDMWLRLSRRYEIVFTPEVCARYRITDGSLISALHNERRVEFFVSSLRLISKHVGTGRSGDDRIRHRMHELGHALDLLDHPAYLELRSRLG